MRQNASVMAVAGVLASFLASAGCKGEGKKYGDEAAKSEDGGYETGGDTVTPPPAPAPPPPPLPPVTDDGGADGDGEAPPDPTTGFNLLVDPAQTSIQKNLIDEYCVSCHSDSAPAAKLNLKDIGLFTQGQHGVGGYHGILIKPGKPSESLLYLVIKSTRTSDQMPPPYSNLPHVKPQQIEAVKAWIGGLPTTAPGGDDEPGLDVDGGDDEPGGSEDGGEDDEPGL